MDIKNSQDYEHNYLTKWDISGDLKYKYEEEGILKKCIPPILFRGNTILATFLQLLDLRIIMTLKYVDRIKKFKYISRY